MKILIAIETHLRHGHAGGTGTWADTMKGALVKAGHTAHIIDRRHPPGRVPTGYDLALIAHGSMMARLREMDCAKVMTCHGILPPQEQPAPGADHYAAVSEEVADHMAGKGYPGAAIIRNPIDINRFAPVAKPNAKLENVLISSRYATNKTLAVIHGACEIAGANLSMIGRGSHSPEPAIEYNEADIVFGLGRTALEAAACGRNVVVYDYNGGDGMLTPGNWCDLRRANFSGRTGLIDYTPEDLAEVLRSYDPERGARLRAMVAEHNDADKIAARYLEFAE